MRVSTKEEPFISTRSSARVVAGAAALVACITSTAIAAGNPKSTPSPAAAGVRVSNHTMFSDLGEMLAEKLGADLQTKIKERGLVVFVISQSFPKERTCFGMAGLSHAPEPGRNARLPGRRFSRFTEVDSTREFRAFDCEIDLINSLIEDLGNADNLFAAEYFETSEINGGSRPKIERAVDKIWFTYKYSARFDTDEDGRVAFEEGLERFLDHRHAGIATYSDSLTIKDGRLAGKTICVAFAGFTARHPDGRNARWPDTYAYSAKLGEVGRADCEEATTVASVSALVRAPWTRQGAFNGFEKTRENGIPLPDFRKLESHASRSSSANPPRADANRSSTSRISTTTTCTNECVNGDCVRTLANGRKERWQAPRKYDPLTSNWTWDITTNACGS